MAHAGQELRFREVGLFRGALCLGQSLLDLPTLGQVTGQLREPARVPRRIPNGREDDVRPKNRAVLAHPPSLNLVSSLGRCRVEVTLRRAARDVRGGIKPGEVLTHDLVRRVPLNPLRARIPAHHATLGIQHHDGGVGDALHHQPESFLGPAQFLLDLFAGRIVGAD